MKLKFSALAVVLLLSIISCNDNVLSKSESQGDIKALEYADANKEGYQAADTSFNAFNTAQQTPTKIAQPNANIDWNKKIIKNGIINLEVKDYSKYYPLVVEIVRREGGYIAQEDQQQSEYKLENSVAIKIPVANFEEAMDLIARGTGNEEVKTRKITSEDVTGEVVDTRSRIEAKKEVRLRYLELLRQAKNMNDILQVQKEINDIQEQMEMASGRVNFLNHASAYSTINLTFYQILNESLLEQKEPSFSTNILSAFLSGWQFIKALIVGVISIWPVWFLAFGVWLAYKKWKMAKPKTN